MNHLQCRMARSALGLGVRDLAERAQVSTNTITRFEGGEALKAQTVALIQGALEAAGVIFIDENGEGPGVRLRKPMNDELFELLSRLRDGLEVDRASAVYQKAGVADLRMNDRLTEEGLRRLLDEERRRSPG